jgi:hypothetical protein
MSELKSFKNLPVGYEKIVQFKNKNIIDFNLTLFSELNLIRDIIFGNSSYEDIADSNNYLN